MSEFMSHRDEEVRKALIRLNDALCMWERTTERQSVLIIREQGGFVFRSVSGKPISSGTQFDVSDEALMLNVQ